MMTGAEHLKDWMARRGFNQQETADYLGWDFTYISKIVNGLRSLGVTNAVHLERLTGIPVESWVSSEHDTATVGAAPDRKKTR